MKQRHAMQQGSLLDMPVPERKAERPSLSEAEKKMSRLEELIAELCPDGVEYKNLGKIAAILRGVRVVKSQLNDTGAYPVYQNSMTPLGYYEKSNCPENTTFIIAAGAAGKIGYSTVKFWAADDCFYINCSVGLNSRYIYYALLCQQRYIDSRVRLASIPRLSRSVVENIYIPVPPLPIQEEIVIILDKFTELTAELTKRKQQYQYYRDFLLTFDNIEATSRQTAVSSILWKKLSSVIDICRGVRVVKKNLQKTGKFPVYQNSMTPLGYHDIHNCDADTTFVIAAGAAGEIGYSKEPFWAADDCYYCICSKMLKNRFLYYILQVAQATIFTKVRRASVPRLSRSVLENIEIPLPPLEAQQRIVSILDRFDALCNDLTSGLPAEIEARKKQYEYYRDKLLSFPEKPRESAL